MIRKQQKSNRKDSRLSTIQNNTSPSSSVISGDDSRNVIIPLNEEQYSFYRQWTPKVVSGSQPRSKNRLLSYLESDREWYKVGAAKQKLKRQRNPHLKRELDRFEDTFRSDGTVKRAILKKWDFILGANVRFVLDVDEEFDTDEERSAALNRVQSHRPYIEAKKTVEKLLKDIDWRTKFHAAGVQASVYGRAAIEKLKVRGKIVDLLVLNSKLLGEPQTNKDNYRFEGVVYLDLPFENNIFKASEIVYITRNNLHLSPGSLHYGLSDLEPVIDGSETKRIIKQEDLKEIAHSLWAGFMIVKFLNPNVTKAQMKTVVDSLVAGTPAGIDHEVEIQVVEVAQNAPMLLELINEMNRETLRDLGIPSPLVGYENIQNYATLQQTLLAWKESDLQSERQWFKNIIQRQLLDELFQQELDSLQLEQNEEQELELESELESELEPQTEENIITNNNKIPKAKLTIEIEDPNFTPYEDLLNSNMTLYNNNLISARKILESIGMDDQIEETERRLAEEREEDRRRFDTRMEVFRSRNGTVIPPKGETLNSKESTQKPSESIKQNRFRNKKQEEE